ncbi:virulence protein RhuM/Fic/DOC family protein [Terrimonas sp. NA20]|uniref:Virulence protein RhuM/Fic/DOC family protein n=1 Tax=Terrimonas ginsenosidimutans TaxID=2908004 RepID=A0ABS9KKH1_9BACT|nr:RhuM family protein [Terrimonas ginsenosidimutans]MCG2612824.1 virulence protein RhuM/Fic/DOC family protein [Terrimonas ginsenosidimutans]
MTKPILHHYNFNKMTTGEIVIYQSEEGNIRIDVQLENETVWLTQDQMAQLFNKAKSTINEHIKNIYIEQELVESETKRKSGNSEFSDKPTNYYNLDVIISVGYRVKSPQGTQFRIWANRVLKSFLINGFIINQQKMKEEHDRLAELQQTVRLLTDIAMRKDLNSEEATGVLKILSDYSYALDVLDQYDHQNLEIRGITKEDLFQINYSEAMSAIHSLRDKFGGSSLFGNEKDDSFQGSLAAIYQTFDGQFLYPSVEEKAANLLYFVVKNHSFSDGNKRIAAFLFVWFLEKNGLLYKAAGVRRIADNALVALTLMIAESKPDEKEMMVKVVVNLINRNN